MNHVLLTVYSKSIIHIGKRTDWILNVSSFSIIVVPFSSCKFQVFVIFIIDSCFNDNFVRC